MIRACNKYCVKLMVAYRLHFEGINLKAIDLMRKGKIGKPKFFNSSFSLTVRPGEHPHAGRSRRTKGQIRVDPAYEYAQGLSYQLTVDGKTQKKRMRSVTNLPRSFSIFPIAS